MMDRHIRRNRRRRGLSHAGTLVSQVLLGYGHPVLVTDMTIENDNFSDEARSDTPEQYVVDDGGRIVEQDTLARREEVLAQLDAIGD